MKFKFIFIADRLFERQRLRSRVRVHPAVSRSGLRAEVEAAPQGSRSSLFGRASGSYLIQPIWL